MTEPTYNRTYEPLKFLGRLFFVPLTAAPKTKHLSYAPTWEDTGEHWGPTVVARIPFTRFAIGVGVWLNAPPIVAFHADDVEYDTYVAVNGQVDRDAWQRMREEIAELGLEPEDEWALMQERGLTQ